MNRIYIAPMILLAGLIIASCGEQSPAGTSAPGTSGIVYASEDYFESPSRMVAGTDLEVLANELRKAPLEKDDYETAKQFEQRQLDWLSNSGFSNKGSNPIIAIRVRVDEENQMWLSENPFRYNADTEQFTFSIDNILRFESNVIAKRYQSNNNGNILSYGFNFGTSNLRYKKKSFQDFYVPGAGPEREAIRSAINGSRVYAVDVPRDVAREIHQTLECLIFVQLLPPIVSGRAGFFVEFLGFALFDGVSEKPIAWYVVADSRMDFQAGQAATEPKAEQGNNKLTAEKNAEFLRTFSMQDGVVKLPSGAMYKVEKAAPAGAKQATLDHEVTVHYSGAFIDGTIFDSSYERGEPATFPLKGLIPGWLEILPLMKEGDVWQVALPYQLGYGEAGRGQIPPRQTLVFKIELIKVTP